MIPPGPPRMATQKEVRSRDTVRCAGVRRPGRKRRGAWKAQRVSSELPRQCRCVAVADRCFRFAEAAGARKGCQDAEGASREHRSFSARCFRIFFFSSPFKPPGICLSSLSAFSQCSGNPVFFLPDLKSPGLFRHCVQFFSTIWRSRPAVGRPVRRNKAAGIHSRRQASFRRAGFAVRRGGRADVARCRSGFGRSCALGTPARRWRTERQRRRVAVRIPQRLVLRLPRVKFFS